MIDDTCCKTIIYNTCCKKPCDISQEELAQFENEYLKSSWFCGLGFMDKNDRLLDIYHADLKTLEDKNITFQQIADVLTSITEKYKRKCTLIGSARINDSAEYSPDIESYHKNELLQLDRALFLKKTNASYPDMCPSVETQNPIIIDKRYLVTCISYWGFQGCPFVFFSKQVSRSETGGGDDYWIYDLVTKKSIQFNDLLIHLIRDHHFFEGNTHHRLDPLTVIDFFDLKSEVDYSCNFVETERWVRVNEGGDISPCWIFAPTNEIHIEHEDANTIIMECTQRDYSQKQLAHADYVDIRTNVEKLQEKLLIAKDDYVFCEILVDGLPIRHRLDMKRVSLYERKKVRYIPIEEESLFPKPVYTIEPKFTTIPKNRYTECIIDDNKLKMRDMEKNIFGEIKDSKWRIWNS